MKRTPIMAALVLSALVTAIAQQQSARDKADIIADFTTHLLTYQSITTTEVRVRVYGIAAVQTGRSTMVGQDRGKAVPRENRFTRVWVMTDGKWQLVANHYSPMTTQ